MVFSNEDKAVIKN